MAHPFITLDIKENASDEEIRKAYLRQIRQYPPESSPTEFQEINQAYMAIKDECSRAEFRLFGKVYEKVPLSSMLPKTYKKRNRVGIRNWINFLKDSHHE